LDANENGIKNNSGWLPSTHTESVRRSRVDGAAAGQWAQALGCNASGNPNFVAAVLVAGMPLAGASASLRQRRPVFIGVPAIQGLVFLMPFCCRWDRFWFLPFNRQKSPGRRGLSAHPSRGGPGGRVDG
jgi:hypothetical protein